MTDKARLHDGDDVRIFDEDGFELINVLKDQINGRIGVSQVGVGGGTGSVIVDKADDQLETSAPGGGEDRPDRGEAVWIKRLGPLVVEPEVDPDQCIGGLQGPDLVGVQGLVWKDRRLFHESPLRIGKVLVGYRIDDSDVPRSSRCRSWAWREGGSR